MRRKEADNIALINVTNGEIGVPGRNVLNVDNENFAAVISENSLKKLE